jgi:hypothetical protein
MPLRHGADTTRMGGGMSHQINVNVQRIVPLQNGKIKVKIFQTNANLLDMNHEGKKYRVLRNLGRGRYIMRADK